MLSLPDFIKEAVGWFRATDNKLDALAKAGAEADMLRASIAQLTAQNDALSKQHSELVKSYQGEVLSAASLAKEVETLKASVESERKRANEVIAGQGLPADSIPSASPASRTETPKNLTLTEQCLAEKRAASTASK